MKLSVQVTGMTALLLLAACLGPSQPPPQKQIQTLSIVSPADGQVVAGTIALAASPVGGEMRDLSFELGSLQVTADANGTATLNTRSLPDGPAILTATATVGGQRVSASLKLIVRNELPSSGTVDSKGGALKSSSGSLAMIPPGALANAANLTVEDLTQDEILAEFGVNYEALGVTFLGALKVSAEGATGTKIPYQVDLAGWAERVQPGQQVLMFGLAPDADGDGVGELMMIADAQATEDGSVITRPVPKAEVVAVAAVGASRVGTLATPGVKPGQLLTLQARGFMPGSPYSNVAIFEPGGLEVLAHATLAEDAAFNPLMDLEVAVPNLPAGTRSVRFKNKSTGYETQPLELEVGSASGDAWAGFLTQVRTATNRLTDGREHLAAQADAWLSALEASEATLAKAMSAQSGLVSASSQSLLEAIAPGSYGAEQRALVAKHALLLDALAVSIPELAQPAADLAALLLVATPQAAETSANILLRPMQSDSGNPCSAPGSEIFGSTGMGSAPPPGGSVCGGAAGGAGAGGSGLSTQAESSFGPIEGAIVRIFKQGTSEKLSPFTTFTDASGYFHIPFVAEGEPFTVHAVDPKTGYTATADGVGPPIGQGVVVPLIFSPGAAEPGAPTASFTITPLPSDPFEGSWHYVFDAADSSDPNGKIVEYIWDFGGIRVVGGDEYVTVQKGYGRNGSYTVRLTVIDDEGKTATTSQKLVIDDLPYDYWGVPPERVSVGADGTIPDEEVFGGNAISADGRYITFTTEAGNLHPDDVNGLDDVYLKDMDTGALELISSGAAGVAVEGGVAMSADARYVAYAASTNYGPTRAYVKDRQTGAVQEIPPEDGLQESYPYALSDDGRVLVFRSYTFNVASRSYVKNLDTGEVTRLGRTYDGTGYASLIQPADISADGRYVVFDSFDDNLVENDTNGQWDVFVTDLTTGETTRVSVASDGTEGNGQSNSCCGSVISADGRYVVFDSEATNFVANDVNGSDADVFVKDLVTGELELVSVNAFGKQADGDSIAPTISADGRYVAFGSYASTLAPLGTYSRGFSYVKDRQTGKVVLVTVGMNNTLPNDWVQTKPRISADGRYVGFYSRASNLVDNDTLDTRDYFRTENPLWEP